MFLMTLVVYLQWIQDVWLKTDLQYIGGNNSHDNVSVVAAVRKQNDVDLLWVSHTVKDWNSAHLNVFTLFWTEIIS